MGELVPILCEEVVPGDSFRIRAETFIRMAPMIAPVMHNVNVYTHFSSYLTVWFGTVSGIYNRW